MGPFGVPIMPRRPDRKKDRQGDFNISGYYRKFVVFTENIPDSVGGTISYHNNKRL
jgi:hypothetical protein